MTEKGITYSDLPAWEVVGQDTYRFKIPGGWLYRYQTRHTHQITVPAIVFVPDTGTSESPPIWEDPTEGYQAMWEASSKR